MKTTFAPSRKKDKVFVLYIMAFWKPIRCNRHLTLTIEKRTFWLIASLATLFIILYLWATPKQLREHKRNTVKNNEPPCIALWWNHFKGSDIFYKFYCNYKKCFLTGDRNLLSKASAIFFYGTDMNWNDLPLPRKPNQIWALFHEESPRNQPGFMFEEIFKHFNYTSTFSRYSDFPLVTNELKNIELITDPRLITSVGQKNNLRSTNLAPVIFLQTDCATMSGRTSYVEDLMKYITIDSYGACLNNREMPKNLQVDFLNNLYSDEILRFIGQYKFMISIENGICNDYITEKFWRALAAGTVPIYFGSPTIKDWEPHKQSAIYITDFKSAKDLANYLLELDKNDTEYIKYLHHKFNQIEPITNMRLIEEMYVRDEHENYNMLITFSCQVLKALLSNSKTNSKIANRLHYSCPQPLPYPAMAGGVPTEVSSWYEIIKRSSCEVKVVDEFLLMNKNYTKKEFDDAVNYKLEQNLC